MAHVLKRRDQEAVRWYVLTLPTAGGGRDRISPSKGLDAELSRRERRGEALFEYFSPSYVEARKVGGKMVNTRQDRKSTRLNSSHRLESRMPSSA